ncbi:PTS sugar transporter subunit IIA [Yokenella regensburgei]|uniref:hypothetical protein n=1 Tax=Yokenella regensburgei TaxID=158877 RepID=UPI003F1792C4
MNAGKYFDQRHFRVILAHTCLTTLCGPLYGDGFAAAAFVNAVVERKTPVSTMFGEGIALLHPFVAAR